MPKNRNKQGGFITRVKLIFFKETGKMNFVEEYNSRIPTWDEDILVTEAKEKFNKGNFFIEAYCTEWDTKMYRLIGYSEIEKVENRTTTFGIGGKDLNKDEEVKIKIKTQIKTQIDALVK